MKPIAHIAVLWTLGAVVFGSLWQIEITILNTVHGWQFAYFATALQDQSNWAARDIFYAVIGVAFILTIVTAYKLGQSNK